MTDKPALRREGRWLVGTDGYSVRADRITSVWPHSAAGTTCVTIDEPCAGEYPWRHCPEGVTPAQVRALIDEALDEAADTVPKSEALGLAYELDNKQDDIDQLRARVAELEAQLAAYQADAPRTFAYSSCAPIEMSPPGSETHRGHPVLTEEDTGPLTREAFERSREQITLDELKADEQHLTPEDRAALEKKMSVGSLIAKIGEERQRAEKAEARVEELLTSSFFGATVLKAEKYEQDNAALRARVAELERERDEARKHANDLVAKLMRADARVAELEAECREYARALEKELDEVDGSPLPAEEVERLVNVVLLRDENARLRAVVEPVRALCDAVRDANPSYIPGPAGGRGAFLVDQLAWQRIGEKHAETRAALDAAEKGEGARDVGDA